MSSAEQPPSASPIKKSKVRSPNYPLVGLEKAVELATGLHTQYGMHSAPITLVHQKWGYKVGSGTGNQAVAALKAYGLVDVTGVGDDRKVTISKVGQRIIGNAPDRASLLKDAAVAPAVHKEILEYYGERGLPDNDLLKQYLVWERGEGQRFNPDSVQEFIDRFNATLSYAGVAVGGKIESESEPEDPLDENDGDDESDADLGVSGRKDRKPKTKSRLERARTMSAGLKEDVYSLDDGAVVVQWPEFIQGATAEDIDGWLKLVGNKIKRAVGKPPEPADDSDED